MLSLEVSDRKSLTCRPAKQHIQAVARKLGKSDGLIYLLGQYAFNIEDSDQSKTWRQRRYFYYCSGVDVPNCCLTYNIATDRLILYIPEIKPERVVWEGRGPTIEEAEEAYDIDKARLNSSLFADLDFWKRNNSRSTFYILHEDHRPVDKQFPKVDSEELKRSIDACRVIKDHYEIQCIRRANEISADAHRAVLKNIRKFKNEAQIQGLFTDTCISNGAMKQSYPVIAGSGENAGTLHYTKNDEPLKGRQLVCLDAGGEYQLYASDVTRTFPISGSWPSEEAKSIYDIVHDMQENCIKRLRPGVKMYDLHIMAHKIAIMGLLKLGILKGDPQDIYDAGTSRAFYPHGLGHHVGLEVHDVIDLPIMRYIEDCPVLDNATALPPCTADQPLLEEGMVITIEPGIYFSRYEIMRAYLSSPIHSKFIDQEVLDRYWAVGGVRIEDDLLITAKGYENLTTAPKGEEALKIIRAGANCAV